jgi:class 3 adenylate cyclase/tetratricopeptide (TPR) repeat protein
VPCSNCGSSNPPGQKFCGSCGTALTEGSATTVPAPASYTPKHLAEKILTSKNALEGERKQVTVLFADLKGSLELLADRDPEEARKILDPVVERMMEAVHHYEGTVNQVMGDGIMALFGAPLAHEDHAVRACYGALRMQQRIARYAEELRRSQAMDVQIRIGLNSGEVVVRAIGSDLRMDYSAVGQTTHLAARMEQLARPGTTLLTANTLALVEGFVEVESLGPLPVKGLSEPVETYALVRASPVRSRLQALAVRGLTRFVGRDAEIESLRHALERARGGHGQVAAVVGEPGVGKSRLFWEFTHSHRTAGWLVLESGSASYGKATPYLPLIEFLRTYFQIEPRDDPRKMREKVTGKMLTLDEALRPALPALLALLDVSGEDAEWRALDPRQRRQRTLQALRHLILRESQVQPLCLVFEDLHWIDTETQAFLDGLVDSLPTARIFLLVNYRPEYQHAWGNKTYYTQLRLDPLAPASADELLSALLGPDRSLVLLKRNLVARTEGNPFFLEETVRTLVETKALVGGRGAYRLATSLPDIQVPPTVQAVVAARIDRLPEEDKRLVQCASVIGETVPLALLIVVSEMSEADLRHGLSRLQAAEFLYETRLFPDLEYTFKHGLTYQVAYNSLLHERRSALHATIAGAMETLYTERIMEHVDRLAHHAFRGERWDRAVGYLRLAGARAVARSANREAVSYFEHALAALGHLPDTPTTLEQTIDLRCDLRNVHLSLGEHDRILEHLRAAEPLAETLNDQRRLGRVLGYLSTYFWLTVNYSRALGHGERALAIARALDDLPFQAEVNQRLAFVYHARGEYDRALELARWNIEALTGDRAREARTGPNLTVVLSRTWLARCLSEQGEFAAAVAHAEEAVRLAESVTGSDSLAQACDALGFVYLHKGDLDRAIAPLDRALGICRTTGITLYLPWAVSHLGLTYALGGRFAEALPLLEEAMECRNSFLPSDSFFRGSLAEGYFLAGRVEDAIPLVQRALTFTRERGERGQEAWSLRLLGEIYSHAHAPNVEQARNPYDEARAIADTLGMRPVVAHCHLGLGKLYHRTGDGAKGQEHLTTAARMYREMDMGFWLARAEAALKEPGPRAGR